MNAAPMLDRDVVAPLRQLVRDDALEERLRAWAREYGGSRYEYIGYARKNLLQTLRDHQGEPPDSGGYRRTLLGTPADEVEAAVQLLLHGRETSRAAHVLRIEYFRPDCPECEKLRQLRAMGVRIGRTVYYDALKLARLAVKMYLARTRDNACLTL